MLNQQTIEKLFTPCACAAWPTPSPTQEDHKPRNSASRNASPLLVAASGAGGRTGHWSGGSGMPVCKVQPAWKISISARHGVWTSR